MPELLLEILSEEIPARMQVRAAVDLAALAGDALKEAGLEFHLAETYVTPRRLALVVDGLPDKQPDISEERRGPRVDAPDKAIEGFLGSVGLSRDEVEARETPKGTFLFAVIDKPGRATRDLLAEILPAVLAKVPWPKSMRWADNGLRWVRPIHSTVCVFAGEAVPFPIGPVTAAARTTGHRFLAPEPFDVSGFDDYVHKLRATKVVLDHQERCQIIGSAAMTLAGEAGLQLNEDHGLLHEVAGLVEWPVVYMGGIDAEFMDLPPEVLITSMKSHQKYFSCLDSAGNLAGRFIMVANTETADGGAAVVAGNERVLRARLSDAKFFWDQDRAQSLESRGDALKDRIFHAKLGSVAEKVERMADLAAALAEFVPGADAEKARRAAKLAKCDLSSGMVGEFPELQGVMGRYYALNDGEDSEIAEAVAEHYSPLGPDEDCPTDPLSVCVALADKIDSLIGFFAIGEKPTGSKDPFALRRAALGVIRLVLENGLRISLRPLLASAQSRIAGGSDAVDDLLAFVADRIKVHLRQQGVRHDGVDAVFSLGGEDDLVRLLARVGALSDFLATEDGGNLLVAYRRAANILRIEEKKDGRSYTDEPDPERFVLAEERALAGGLAQAGPEIEQAVSGERFADAMAALAALRQPVDAFFDHVTVNTDDAGLRENRLKLLSKIRSALDGVADFSCIEG